MQLRDFDPLQEKLAAAWARVAMILPDGWYDPVNEETLEEAAASAVIRGRKHIGLFEQGGVKAYAKLPGDKTQAAYVKIVSDLAYRAGLPVAPEVLVRVGDNDVINLSMVPFNQCADLSATEHGHPITTVAMVVNTWVQAGVKHKCNDICITDEGERARAALFDFESAVHNGLGVASEFFELIGTEYAGSAHYRQSVALTALQNISALGEDDFRAVVERLPDDVLWQEDKDDVVDFFMGMRKRLPEVVTAVAFGHP